VRGAIVVVVIQIFCSGLDQFPTLGVVLSTGIKGINLRRRSSFACSAPMDGASASMKPPALGSSDQVGCDKSRIVYRRSGPSLKCSVRITLLKRPMFWVGVAANNTKQYSCFRSKLI